MRESEYSAAAPATGGALTLDSLLDPLAAGKGGSYVDARKKLRSLERASVTAKPLQPAQEARALRKVSAKAAEKDVSLWTGAVKQNREAETLDFRDNRRHRHTAGELAGKFEAGTDFERRVEEALDGEGERELREREREAFGFGGDGDEPGDDLGAAGLTAAEFKRRHGQLAKLRSLMFYEERKRHQVNKIKSKKFRKIHKKQEAREKEKEME